MKVRQPGGAPPSESDVETTGPDGIPTDMHGNRVAVPVGTTFLRGRPQGRVPSREILIERFNKLVEGCWSTDDPERQIERDKYIAAAEKGEAYTPSRYRDAFGHVRLRESGERADRVELLAERDMAKLLGRGDVQPKMVVPSGDAPDDEDRRRFERGRKHLEEVRAQENFEASRSRVRDGAHGWVYDE